MSVGKELFHLVPEALGQAERAVAIGGEHFTGRLPRQRGEPKLGHLVGQILPAPRCLGKELAGRAGVPAELLFDLIERLADPLLAASQFFERQLVFAAELAGAVVGLGLCGQLLLRPVQGLELVKVLLQFLHQAQVFEGLRHVRGRLLLGPRPGAQPVCRRPF